MKQSPTVSRYHVLRGWRRQPCYRWRLAAFSAVCFAVCSQPIFLARIGSRPLDGVNLQTSPIEGTQDTVPVLELNDPVVRELLQGETHSYRFRIEDGQYLRVAVERWGADLKLVIRDRKGLIRTDVTCRSDGPLPVSLIAEESDVFLLELRTQGSSATPARYRLDVEERRLASTRDRSRLAAEQAFVAASRLRADEREASSRQAIKRYEAARIAWKAAGDERGEVIALRSIAEMHEVLGETKKAFTNYDQALSLSRRAKDARGEGEALAAIAYLQFFLGDMQQALENATAALALSQSIGNRRGEARALYVMGEAHYGFGDLAKAVQIQEQALSLWRALNDARGEAQSLVAVGYVYRMLSETRKALDAYQRALVLSRDVRESRGEALALMALGNLQNKLGDRQEALNSHLRARQLIEPTGDRSSTASVLGNIAVVYQGLGEERRALEYSNQVLALFQATDDRWGAAETQLDIGRTYYRLGENEKALNAYRPALTTFHELKMARLEAQTLRDIGLVHDALGDRDRALDYYTQSLQLTRAGQDQRDAAYTLNYMGRLYSRLGRPREALDYYGQALPLARTFGDRFAESLTFYNMAGAQRGLGELTEARATIESALNIVESLRTKVASQELRASYFASVRQYYDLLIDLLMSIHGQQPSGGFAAEALVASERARARSLIELLAEARADVRQGVDQMLLQRERSIAQRLDVAAQRQARLLSGKHTKEEAAALDKELVALTIAREEVRSQINAQSPGYAALTQVQPLGIREMQELLDDRTLLLEYALGDERSYLWAATRTSLTSYELPRRADVEGAARLVYDDLRARQRRPNESEQDYSARVRQADARYWQHAAALSEMTLGPVAAELADKRLLIAAEGALQYIPFAALPTPNAAESMTGRRAGGLPTPLMVDHEIVNLPSASALAALRRETSARRPAPRSVALLADPVFELDDSRISADARKTAPARERPAATTDLGRALRDVSTSTDGFGLPRLLSSRAEAKAISALAPVNGAMIAMGFDATRAKAMSAELSQYRIIHFATHGLLNGEHPELSGIVLSLVDHAGRPQNGFLRLHDIYNLDLPAELVVLSACDTGLGKEVKGEGLVGLARGFMYAGAARVVASLWKVDDEATADLMAQFYRRMLEGGKPPAAALREAQIAIWKQKRWNAPYYWAAFVLQGEWR
jgi:CHAT domain-containing protein/tetratricopeptide (TPR) repeat protein